MMSLLYRATRTQAREAWEVEQLLYHSTKSRGKRKKKALCDGCIMIGL